MDVFSIKAYNLDETVTNVKKIIVYYVKQPFGNQVPTLNLFDGKAQQAHTGDSRMDYDKVQVKTGGPGVKLLN